MGMQLDRRLVFTAAMALAMGAMANGARAEAVTFKDKQIRIVVGSSAGAGFDAFGRMVGRHLGEHLPGRPNVIVSNMPGAGSLRAVQSVRTQPADGTYIVLFNPGQVLNSILQPGKVKVNFTNDVTFLGSASADARVCYAWHTTGVKTLKDLLARKEPFATGHTGTSAATYIDAAILKNLFKAPIKQIVGYPGSTEQQLGVERGELHGDCGSWGSVPRHWIKDKKINIFVRISKVSLPELKDVPFVGDFADEEQKKIIFLLTTHNDMFRPFIVHKDTPPAVLKVLREAFWKTVNGKAMLAEAHKSNREVIEPMRGEELAKVVAELYKTPPNLVTRAAAAVK
ncbi:MAG: Bug family tripartite tricarboxylate transporter substrate binding protein [Xanthobacteraceae bacterium]